MPHPRTTTPTALLLKVVFLLTKYTYSFTIILPHLPQRSIVPSTLPNTLPQTWFWDELHRCNSLEINLRDWTETLASGLDTLGASELEHYFVDACMVATVQAANVRLDLPRSTIVITVPNSLPRFHQHLCDIIVASLIDALSDLARYSGRP